MFYIISGTDRPDSRSYEVAQFVKPFYEKNFANVEIINLADLGLNSLTGQHYGEAEKPEKVAAAIAKLDQCEGMLVICPEYNGSMPGALKYFIDFWSYPKTFEYRPVAFIGLGGQFGGLRPVEHLQQVFGYRNAFILPNRVFLINVWGLLNDGKITDKTIVELLQIQADNFGKFIKGLKDNKLSANHFSNS